MAEARYPPEQLIPQPDLVFDQLAAAAGSSVLRDVIERGKAGIAAGHQGVVFSDPEANWQMSVTRDGVYFRLGHWGPYVLEDSAAMGILNRENKK